MKYKITKQYSEYAEILCAEFDDINDSLMFINKSILTNKENVVYWVFENNKLNINIFNQDVNQNKLTSRYATNKDELPFQISNPFNVNIIVNDKEITIAKFHYYNDAKLFAITKLNQDTSILFYCIFDGEKLVERIDQSTQDESNANGEKKKIFRPTPFPNKPRLGPGGYWVDEDENE